MKCYLKYIGLHWTNCKYKKLNFKLFKADAVLCNSMDPKLFDWLCFWPLNNLMQVYFHQGISTISITMHLLSVLINAFFVLNVFRYWQDIDVDFGDEPHVEAEPASACRLPRWQNPSGAPAECGNPKGNRRPTLPQARLRVIHHRLSPCLNGLIWCWLDYGLVWCVIGWCHVH